MTNRRRPPTSWVLALIGIVLLGVILVPLVAVPLTARQAPPADTTYALGNFLAALHLSIGAGGAYELRVEFTGADGQPADPPGIAATLSMEGHAMSATPVSLKRLERGSYLANGTLGMLGGWQLSVMADGGTATQRVDFANSF